MKNEITIVGAGMAGLLAANLLRTDRPIRVLEAQRSLPNNHSAVLRFRSNVVGEALGIPFTRVTMIKDVVPWRNPVADALAYSRKNGGIALSNRSINAGAVVGERYIAPANFIEWMERKAIKRGVQFEYGAYWQPSDKRPVISTLPMPKLMELIGYEQRVPFYHSTALSVRATIRNCAAYATLLFPDPAIAFSRASITGSELIVEVPRFNFDHGGWPMAEAAARFIAVEAASYFGFNDDDVSEVSAHKQAFAKILPMDERVRKHFIYLGTHAKEIFALGRFATWRPGLLLDDLVKDIALISDWIATNDMYNVARKR